MRWVAEDNRRAGQAWALNRGAIRFDRVTQQAVCVVEFDLVPLADALPTHRNKITKAFSLAGTRPGREVTKTHRSGWTAYHVTNIGG